MVSAAAAAVVEYFLKSLFNFNQLASAFSNGADGGDDASPSA